MRRAFARRFAALLVAISAILAGGSAAAAQSDTGAQSVAPAARSTSANDDRRLRLFGAIGYAPQDDSDAGSLGLALAAKANYALLGWIHLGLEGTYHVGTRFGDELNRISYGGLELGARLSDRRLGRFGLTPYLTGGIASVSTQRNIDPSFLTGYYGLGAALDVIIWDWLLAGLDLRWTLIPSSVRQGDNSGGGSSTDLLVMLGARL
jgi:hypothetical protein